MKYLLFLACFAPFSIYCSQAAPEDLPVSNGYRSMSAYGLMHFILDENNELVGVFTSEQEVRRTVNIDAIVDEFFPINIIRYGRTGNLSTDVITRLAQTESRERQSHGKDHFWNNLLEKRKEEEEATRIVNALDSIK